MFFKNKKFVLCITTLLFCCMIPMNVRCETYDTLENTIQKVEDAKSMHTSVSMTMEVDAFGFDVETEAEIDMISFKSPYKVQSEISLDMGLLGEKEWTVYGAKKDGTYQIYEKNNKKWNAREAQAKELLKYDGRNLMKIFLSQIEDLEKEGIQKKDGRQVVKYSGVITGEGQKKILLDAGCVELVDKLFKNSVLKPFGTLVEQQDKIEEMMKMSVDLPITLWVDKESGYPIQCKMDITEMIGDSYKDLTESMSSDKLRKLAEKVKINRTQIIIECDDFNAADNFVLPIN